MGFKMIEVNGLTKTYARDGREQIVLDNLFLKIKDKEKLGIIGSSGCGKTTLIKCIIGSDKDFSGEIIYDGYNVLSKQFFDQKKYISIVFQDYGLFLNKTVLQNLLIPLIDVQKIRKNEAIKIAENKLKSLNILDQKNKYPSELSGGQKQRVAIARALVTNPKLLVLDEPNSALDIESTKNLVNIINGLDESITLIIVSHSIEFLKKTCTKIAFINNGKVEELSSTRAFFNKPNSNNLKTFLRNLQ